MTSSSSRPDGQSKQESAGQAPPSDGPARVHLVKSSETWIEGEAVRQLEATARLAGMRLCVGMPDLHPGKGHPIGAAMVARGVVYPHLVGGDIGCGMGLWQTDLKQKKIKRDKWAERLHGLETPWDGDTVAWLGELGIEAAEHDQALGTIGGGNHFAEVGEATRVLDRHGTILLDQPDDGSGIRPEVHRGDLRRLLLDSLPAGSVKSWCPSGRSKLPHEPPPPQPLLNCYYFYSGSYVDEISNVLDTNMKTIVHIPNVNSRESTQRGKTTEVSEIMGAMGTWKGKDLITGFDLVERAAITDHPLHLVR